MIRNTTIWNFQIGNEDRIDAQDNPTRLEKKTYLSKNFKASSFRKQISTADQDFHPHAFTLSAWCINMETDRVVFWQG